MKFIANISLSINYTRSYKKIMKEFTFDPDPIKFKIKSIQGSRMEITSVADIGNIEFTVFGKPDTLEEIRTKYDLDITHMKFLTLDGPKDYRIVVMNNFISNDEKADSIINCMHIHADPESTDEEKKAASRIVTAGINAFYRAYIRSQELEEARREALKEEKRAARGRPDFRSGSDSRSDSRSDIRSNDYPDAPQEVAPSVPQEPQEPVVTPRKQRVARPAPKKSTKQKPVRVRTNRPKASK